MNKKIEYRKVEATPNVAEKMREYTNKTSFDYDRIISYIEARAKLGECGIMIGESYKNDSLLTKLHNEGFLLTKEEDGTITINW